MSKEAKILNIDPQLALPGGEVVINCDGLDTSEPTSCAVWFGDERANIVAISPRRVLAIVPEQKQSGTTAPSDTNASNESARLSPRLPVAFLI